MASSQYDSKRGSRLIARVFALLALALVTVVVVAVVSNSLDSSSTATSTTTSKTAAKPPAKPKVEYYVVKSGDTFSGIAAKEGISRGRLLQLNRDRGIDPDVLQPKQCVEIVAGGCKKLAEGG